MGLLDGKVAIVTGSAGGIGTASARAIGAEGAHVVCVDLDGQAAQGVADAIVADGGRAIAVQTDQSDEAQAVTAVETAVREFGGVDILFNNGAATGPDTVGREGHVHELDLEVWNRTMAVNVGGYMLFVKHVIPHLLRRGGGVIVNTSSGTGLAAEYTRAAYATSKAAIIGFTRNVATQYGKQGVRCVCIAPGIIMTPAVSRNMPPEALEVLANHHLTPRLGTPEDIANLVVFLVSDRAGFITGVTIPIDGGILSHLSTYPDERAMYEATHGHD
jgi:NAD(P)-dependent dehydrogenase (short-subunit alcohol dehydrogenase family)